MSDNLTPQQQEPKYLFPVNHLLDVNDGEVKDALTTFLKLSSLKSCDLHELHSDFLSGPFFSNSPFSKTKLLFNENGPFETFECFKTFLQNLSIFIEVSYEIFPDSTIVHFPLITDLELSCLHSNIEITRVISLHDLFFLVLDGDRDTEDERSMLQTVVLLDKTVQSLAMFNESATKLFFYENVFLRCSVQVENEQFGPYNGRKFIFPKDWFKNFFGSFVERLTSTLGFSEVPYLGETSKNTTFSFINNYFKVNGDFSMGMLTESESMPMFAIDPLTLKMNHLLYKQTVALFRRFLCHVNEEGLVTPHINFKDHMPHFVLAYMRLIDVPLTGISLPSVIKTGPVSVWISNKRDPLVVVCSSVALNKRCNNSNCGFLHPIQSNCEFGIVTTHTEKGNVMVVCRQSCMFDKPVNTTDIFKDFFRSNRNVSF